MGISTAAARAAKSPGADQVHRSAQHSTGLAALERHQTDGPDGLLIRVRGRPRGAETTVGAWFGSVSMRCSRGDAGRGAPTPVGAGDGSGAPPGATMLSYLDQLAVSRRPGTIHRPTPRCGCSPPSCWTTTRSCARPASCNAARSRSSNGSSSGVGTTAPPAARCSSPTSPKSMTRSQVLGWLTGCLTFGSARRNRKLDRGRARHELRGGTAPAGARTPRRIALGEEQLGRGAAVELAGLPTTAEGGCTLTLRGRAVPRVYALTCPCRRRSGPACAILLPPRAAGRLIARTGVSRVDVGDDRSARSQLDRPQALAEATRGREGRDARQLCSPCSWGQSGCLGGRDLVPHSPSRR